MEDASGRVGDELDLISLRDIAAVRYVRHHEWLELVLGTAISTEKITAPKISTGTSGDWTRDDPESLKNKIAEIDRELKALEQRQQDIQSNKSGATDYSPTSALYTKLTNKLQDDFGKVPADADEYQENIYKELKAIGKAVVERRRVNVVKELEPLTEPEPQMELELDADLGLGSPVPELEPEIHPEVPAPAADAAVAGAVEPGPGASADIEPAPLEPPQMDHDMDALTSAQDFNDNVDMDAMQFDDESHNAASVMNLHADDTHMDHENDSGSPAANNDASNMMTL